MCRMCHVVFTHLARRLLRELLLCLFQLALLDLDLAVAVVDEALQMLHRLPQSQSNIKHTHTHARACKLLHRVLNSITNHEVLA